MLFYDLKGFLLIYKNNSNFYFPKVITDSDTLFIDNIKNETNIDIQDELVEKYLEIINCEIRFNKINEKIKKEYIKIIKDYYCCLISFEKYKNKIFKQNLYGNPKIMKIDDIISCYVVSKNYCCNTLQSVYELKKKIQNNYNRKNID